MIATGMAGDPLTDEERREALAAMAAVAKKWRYSLVHATRHSHRRRPELANLPARLATLNAARRKLGATIEEGEA